MAAVKRRGKWWVDFRFKGKRHRRVSPIDTKRGAEKFELALKNRLLDGKLMQATLSPTFKVFSDKWVRTYVESNNKGTEIRKKKSILKNHLLPELGSVRLKDIGIQTIERYKAKKKSEGLAPKTINNHLTILRKALSSAKDWGVIKFVPDFKWLSVQKSKPLYLSERDQETLLSTDMEEVWHAMILIGLHTGMRIGEILGLHWEDVNFDESMLTVQYTYSDKKELTSTKSNRIRHIPMSPELCDRLKSVSFRRKKGRVFEHDPNGDLMNRHKANHALRRIKKQTEVELTGWHTLRHTFATRMCSSGVSIRLVQHILGHADIRTTERYSHVDTSLMKDAVLKVMSKQEDFGHYAVTVPVEEQFFTPISSIIESIKLPETKEKPPQE